MSDFLTRRNGTWHFVRRVPSEFSRVDRRGVVRHSTRIKITADRAGRRASRVAAQLNEQLELSWREMAKGSLQEETCRYDVARKRARSLGYEYIEIEQLMDRPAEVTIQRLETLGANKLVGAL
jgi:hypothetical protein